MNEQKIKEYIKKEIIFQNLQNQKAKTDIALQILITTGLIQISEIIYINKRFGRKKSHRNNKKGEIKCLKPKKKPKSLT